MKRYLAILCSSLLFSGSLFFGFIRAEDQIAAQSVLQNSESHDLESQDLESQLPDDIAFDDISVDDISVDDIEEIEETAVVKDLSFVDKAKLAWLYVQIRTGEYKDKAVKHYFENEREYLYGAATGLLVFALAYTYYLNLKNKEIVTLKN